MYSTPFFFDTPCGFTKDEAVLGPWDNESFAQQRRNPVNMNPAALAAVRAVIGV